MPKVAFHNLGCKVNSYETEAMEQLMTGSGYELVPFCDVADVYVINTCSVTNIADRKSRQVIHRARKQNPNAIVVATGCYAQVSKDKLLEDDSVDIIIGNNKKKNILEEIEEFKRNKEKTCAVIDIMHDKTYECLNIGNTNEHTRAYIKIQDGCNQFCSYCIIPYARGRVRSRKEEDVISEVKRLSDAGFKEVVLTGIHLSSYGVDTGSSLIDIIEKIHEISGIERIRLGSLEPGIITKEFLVRLSKLEKICPHFHLSLQSGSDGVLKRMNRKYTSKEYYDKCCLIREFFDKPALTTDIIVGFPGETDEEFEETLAFVKKVSFFEVHVFKYSRRKGTKADLMENQIREDVKTKRSAELIELTDKLSIQYIESLREKCVEVLVEERLQKEGNTVFTGHTKEYIKVLLKSDENIINTVIKGKIVDENPLNFNSIYIRILE